MTVTLETVVTIASWVTALGVIYAFIRKIVKPLQDMNTAITLMQRERLESAHAIYVNCLGWCPSGEKTVLSDIYKHYTSRGNNHIAEDYIERLVALPEHAFPKSMMEKGVIQKNQPK